MLVPGRGYENSRLADAEIRGDRMLRTKEARASQEPKAFRPRRGEFLGITSTSVTRAGGTVQLIFKSGNKYRYCRDADNEIQTVQASACMLNTADSIESDTVVEVKFFGDNHWEIVNAWCEARDWKLEDEESTGTPGSTGGDSTSSSGTTSGALAPAVASTTELTNAAIAASQDFGSSGGQFVWQV